MEILPFLKNKKPLLSDIELLEESHLFLPMTGREEFIVSLFNKKWRDEKVVVFHFEKALTEDIYYYLPDKKVLKINPHFHGEYDSSHLKKIISDEYHHDFINLKFFTKNKLPEIKKAYLSSEPLTAKEILRGIHKIRKITNQENFEVCKDFSSYWNGDKKPEGGYCVRLYSPQFFVKIIKRYYQYFNIDFVDVIIPQQ